MKFIQRICILLFAVIIMIPVVFFNTESNSVSTIDNRVLTENPFTLDGDLTSNIQNYINDRIGFRDEMITSYTVLNDKLFGKMVHPSYEYGKDGYVFGAGLTTNNNFGDFHIAFADLVSEIQTYCNERNIPFLFVFNPAKPAVYQDKIANGINYNREWVNLFLEELNKRGINYLDNTETMISLRNRGIDGFNQKYDANHWNDLGAFYGTQKILERMKEMCDSIHVNELDEFTVSETLQTSLPVSKFPINEYAPSLALKNPTTNLQNNYLPELNLDKSYRTFGYYLNPTKNTPKALVFQGSYMNGHGSKYMQNAFSEYIHIHDYQNILNFPYYFNIFQPDCVIFEVAEYTFSNAYFNYEKMKKADFNPSISSIDKNTYSTIEVANEKISVNKGTTLTTISWFTENEYQYAWLSIDSTYDMQKTDSGYQVTIETKNYETSQQKIQIFVMD